MESRALLGAMTPAPSNEAGRGVPGPSKYERPMVPSCPGSGVNSIELPEASAIARLVCRL